MSDQRQFIVPGTSGNVGIFGSPTPQTVAASATPAAPTLAAMLVEVGAVFALTLFAGTSASSANLCLAIVLTLWVLRLVHYYST